MGRDMWDSLAIAVKQIAMLKERYGSNCPDSNLKKQEMKLMEDKKMEGGFANNSEEVFEHIDGTDDTSLIENTVATAEIPPMDTESAEKYKDILNKEYEKNKKGIHIDPTTVINSLPKPCPYCDAKDDEIHSLPVEGDEDLDFRVKLGEGELEFSVTLHLEEDQHPFIEIYRYLTIDGFGYDGFDKCMKIPINFCPFCGRDLTGGNNNGQSNNIR